jgi:hypothetical protein
MTADARLDRSGHTAQACGTDGDGAVARRVGHAPPRKPNSLFRVCIPCSGVLYSLFPRFVFPVPAFRIPCS